MTNGRKCNIIYKLKNPYSPQKRESKVHKEVKRMVEVINKYETLFVIDASKTEEETVALIDKFKSLIEANGTIESVDEWGRRRLAYAINDMNEGYYVLINFSAKGDFPAELERVFGITDGILRSMVVRKDEK